MSILVGYEESLPDFLVKAMGHLADHANIMSLVAGLGAQVFDMTATSLAYISLDEVCEMRSQHEEGMASNWANS